MCTCIPSHRLYTSSLHVLGKWIPAAETHTQHRTCMTTCTVDKRSHIKKNLISVVTPEFRNRTKKKSSHFVKWCFRWLSNTMLTTNLQHTTCLWVFKEVKKNTQTESWQPKNAFENTCKWHPSHLLCLFIPLPKLLVITVYLGCLHIWFLSHLRSCYIPCLCSW